MSDTKLGTWEDAVQHLKTLPEAAELVKACFYDDPLIDSAERYYNSSEWRAILEILAGRGGSALDVGAGRGISTYALAKSGWKVAALEPDGSAIVGAGAIRNLSEAANLGISVTQDWGEQLPFEDASFDLVHCRQVLHHAKDLGKLCAEVGRVLKPNGMLLATREHVVSHQHEVSIFQAQHPLHRLYGGEFAFTLAQYRHAIAEGGLTVVEELNPKASDINLYPETMENIKKRWASKLMLPSPKMIPNILLRVAGSINRVPGRLYTFVCVKSHAK